MNSQENDMLGKVCLVSGATAGIGEAAALLLAQRGATVVGIGRNPAKNEASTKMIREKTGNPAVGYLLADLSSQEDIRAVAQQFLSKYERLDVLVNNAGATFGERHESVDGIEMTFALNHLGYFLLTNLLLDILETSAPSRVRSMYLPVYTNWANSILMISRLKMDMPVRKPINVQNWQTLLLLTNYPGVFRTRLSLSMR